MANIRSLIDDLKQRLAQVNLAPVKEAVARRIPGTQEFKQAWSPIVSNVAGHVDRAYSPIVTRIVNASSPAKNLANMGKILQRTPTYRIQRTPLIKPIEPFTKMMEFGPNLIGEQLRSYGRTAEQVATPAGRQALKQSVIRIVHEKPSLKTLSEPGVEAALNIPDFLPGGLLFSGGVKAIAKVGGKKVLKEMGEKTLKSEVLKMDITPLKSLLKKFEEVGSAIVAQRPGARMIIKDEGDFVKVGIDTGKLVSTDIKLPEVIFKTKEEAFNFIRKLESAVKPAVKSVEGGFKAMADILPGIKPGEGLNAAKRGVGAVKTALADTKYAFNINLERLATTKRGKEFLIKAVEKIKPELEAIKGATLTHKEVLEEALKSKILETASTRAGQKTAEAALLRTRQQLAAVSDQISKLGGNAPKAIWNEYKNLMKTVSAYATEKGRGLEMLKQEAAKTIGISGSKLRDEMFRELLKAGNDIDQIVKQMKNVNFDNAREATEFYRKFVAPTMGEKLNFFRYVNMLSSPSTQVVNIVGNLLQAPLAVGEKLVSGVVDRVAAALTGQARQHFVREVPAYVRGFLSSIPDAYKGFKDAFAGKTALVRPDLDRLAPYTQGLGWKYGGFLRFMEGADVFFQTLFKLAARESLAYKAMRTGKELGSEALEAAVGKEGLYRVFRQPLGEESSKFLNWIDKMTTGIYQLRSVPGVGWVVPFVQTPMNILKQGVEFSPFGVTAIPGAADKVTQISRTLLGSMVTMGAAAMALEGRTTWSAPLSENEKQAFYASGKQPYSLRIGDKWVSFSKLGPAAYPIAMAASFKDKFEDNPEDSALENMGKAVLAMGKFFSDQSYMQSIGNLVGVLEGESGKNVSRFISGLTRQVIPLASLQSWAARLIDDVYRNPQTIVQNIAATLPFLSKTVPAKRTPTGEESKREFVIFNSLSPFQITQENPYFNQVYRAYQLLLRTKKVKRELEDIAQNKDLTDEMKREKILEKLNNYKGKEAEFIRLYMGAVDQKLKTTPADTPQPSPSPVLRVVPTLSPAGRSSIRVKKPILAKTPTLRIKGMIGKPKSAILKVKPVNIPIEGLLPAPERMAFV